MSYEKKIEKAVITDILLDSLSIYRNLLDDPVLESFRRLVKSASSADDAIAGLYGEFVKRLADMDPVMDFRRYIIKKVLFDENPFTKAACEGFPVKAASALLTAARSDLYALQQAVSLTSQDIRSCLMGKPDGPVYLKELAQRLPDWPSEAPIDSSCAASGLDMPAAEEMAKSFLEESRWENLAERLADFHSRHGCGLFAQYPAFTWHRGDGRGALVPVINRDPVRLTDLIAYEVEREEVIINTRQLLKGYPANNVLLYGDRGTGKSSTVKAILNEYHSEGLRMVEVPKSLLSDFPEIVRGLAGKKLKFIIFIDDLAFEDDEETYTSLKAALEGGLETRPQNVLIYATSNRRHLIKERFSERAGLQFGGSDDEIRASDTMQEKLSLSDRFGITVVFSAPDKERFLRIVEGLALRKGITLDRDTLHKEALKWELWYNGRSPRTACQFINWLEGLENGN